jgi:cohesin complex subunit SCC1
MSPPPQQSSEVYNSPSKQSYQPQDDWDNDNFETDNYGNDDYEDDEEDEDFYNDNEKPNPDDDMQDDETIEDFENRVLNKRAALLHKQLNKKFANTFSQLSQKCNRKQVAQKFHSILVLQKMMALDINQEMEPPYADISIRRGSAWEAGGGL